jgi:hypothetical protein
MRAILSITAMLLISTSVVFGQQTHHWDKVRYNGGPLTSNVDSKEWNNLLTVSPELITLKLKDGRKIEIPTKSVTGLSYGQEAYRQAELMIALVGLFHKRRQHFVGIEYVKDGKKDALLLQGDKDDYRDILVALKNATGAVVSVADSDREFVPDSVRPAVVAEAAKKEPAEAPKRIPGILSITSEPEGAAVYIDHDLSGHCPVTVNIGAGKHRVTVVQRGYIDWTRDLKVSQGEETTLKAVLEKSPSR